MLLGNVGITLGGDLLGTLVYPGSSCSWSWTMWEVWDDWSTVIHFRDLPSASTSLEAFPSSPTFLGQYLVILTVTQEGRMGEVENRLCWWFIKPCGFWLLHKTPHQRVRLGSCRAPSSFAVGIGLYFLPFAFDSELSCCSLSWSTLTRAPQQLPLHANWVHWGTSVGQPEGKGWEVRKESGRSQLVMRKKIPNIKCHDE